MAERKGSGEKATEEAKTRSQTRAQQAEKAKKAAAEGGVTPTAPPVENRQDVLVVAGEDVRDGAEVKEPTTAQAEKNEKALADPKVVDRFSVLANTDQLILEVDGEYFTFNVQQSLALRRLVNAGAVNLNS